MFFIDHTARTTTFIDPRLPNDLPLMPAPPNSGASGSSGSGSGAHLLLPTDPNGIGSLLPPLPPRHHGASLTPPPTATGSRSPSTLSGNIKDMMLCFY